MALPEELLVDLMIDLSAKADITVVDICSVKNLSSSTPALTLNASSVLHDHK